MKWDDIKDNVYLYGTIVFVSVFLVSLLIFDTSELVDTISKRNSDKRRIQENYDYLENHSVWSELDALYSYAEEHHTCTDDECDFHEFEEAWYEVSAYCEAASYIAANRSD